MADTVTAQSRVLGRRAWGEDVYCLFVQTELSLKAGCWSSARPSVCGTVRGAGAGAAGHVHSLASLPSATPLGAGWKRRAGREEHFGLLTALSRALRGTSAGTSSQATWPGHQGARGRWHAAPGDKHSCCPPWAPQELGQLLRPQPRAVRDGRKTIPKPHANICISRAFPSIGER